MKTVQNTYNEKITEIRKIDRQLKCLSACFKVVSQPELMDSVNYQMLALKARRLFVLEEIREMYPTNKETEK